MSLESTIYGHLTAQAGLTALVGTRIYPLTLPQGVAYPAISYQRINGTIENTLAGPSGLVNLRLQMDVWASSYAQAKNAAQSLRSAMITASSFTALPLSDQDLYEPDTGLYRVSVDFSVWGVE